MPVERSYAIITGATSGIGASFAEHFATNGYHLVITGRRKEIIENVAEELRAAHGIEVQVIIADFVKEDDFAAVISHIEQLDHVGVLVNNVGFGLDTSFVNDTYANQEKMITVHINATTRLTHIVIPKMLKNGTGTIINVSSLAAFLPNARNELYCATKAYINAFSESLHVGLRDKHIRVQALCPGFTKTDFHDKMGLKREAIMKKHKRVKWMEPDEVVQISVKALKRGSKVLVVPGFNNRFVYGLVKHLPRKWYYRIVAKVAR
jgi:short-subunit dehydrogenase